MGRHGPAPEPVAAKLARGETRPSRVNYEAPIPRQARPSVPRSMSAAAKYVWRRVISEQAPGVILAVDRDMLRVYCEAVVRYEESAVLYAESSPLVSTRGNLVKNPLHQLVRDNAEQMRLFARELGLSPAARAGLRMDAAHPTQGIEQEIGLPPRLRVVGGGDA